MTAKGLSFGNFVICFVTFLSAAIFPFVPEDIIPYVWFIFSIAMVIAAVFVFYKVKETRGLSFEDS